jgi:Zn finger protein HypA/HybF involved in hydrogenase expression
MIELSASTAFMVYLGTTLAVLWCLWMYEHLKMRGRHILESTKPLLQTCEFCHHVYLEDPTKVVTQCPQCHSYNK